MSRSTEKDRKYVRLNRTPFTQEWEVVRLAADGRTIKHRWPIHPNDAAALEAAFGPALPPGGPDA